MAFFDGKNINFEVQKHELCHWQLLFRLFQHFSGASSCFGGPEIHVHITVVCDI